ncbi:ABC transporter ATP-binding protein [Lacunimicrobium album]
MQVQLEHITKRHRSGDEELTVVDDLTCDIQESSFTFIIGPSGSGKSSLLYLIGALDLPSQGRVLIDGEDLSTWSSTRKNKFRREEIGFIFQSFNLLKQLTAVDNVLVSEMPVGVSSEDRQRAVDYLKQVGLGHRLSHYPSQLSGGEQQRVAIARALLKEPSLVLADEPTGELDSKTGAIVMGYLRELQKQKQTTVIIVTHDHIHLRPGDHIIELHDGKIVRQYVKDATPTHV